MNSGCHGLLAEFATPDALLAAAHRARAAGYRHLDAYAPFAVAGLAEAVGFRETRLPPLILLCAVLGGAAALLLQYYTLVVDFPLNVGGRPYASWPSFMPVTFEFTVLGAVLAAFAGMLALNGLPQPYHPLFEAEGFRRASADRFFLCIQASDPSFRRETAREFLAALEPLALVEIGDAPP